MNAALEKALARRRMIDESENPRLRHKDDRELHKRFAEHVGRRFREEAGHIRSELRAEIAEALRESAENASSALDLRTSAMRLRGSADVLLDKAEKITDRLDALEAEVEQLKTMFTLRAVK